MNYPKDKQWRGIYPGNYTGSVWQTRNIDLTKSPGRAILSDKMRIQVDATDTDMSNLTDPITKFLRTNADATDRPWGLKSRGRLFNGGHTSPASTWAQDTVSNTLTDPLDMEVHESANGEQRFLATRATDIGILKSSSNANGWDNGWGTTVASVTAL